MKLSQRAIRFTLFAVLVFSLFGFGAQAVEITSTCQIKYTPSVGIPFSDFKAGQEMLIDCSSAGNYIKAFYTFGVMAGTIVAVLVLMVAGFMWLTAAGNVTQISQAKTYIGGAMTGLVLLLLSFTILQTINPKLVEFQPLNISEITKINDGINDCQPDEICSVSGLGNCGYIPDNTLAAQQAQAAEDGEDLVPGTSDEDCGAPTVQKPAGSSCYCHKPSQTAVVCCYDHAFTATECPARSDAPFVCSKFSVQAVRSGQDDPCNGKPFIAPDAGQTCEQTVNAKADPKSCAQICAGG